MKKRLMITVLALFIIAGGRSQVTNGLKIYSTVECDIYIPRYILFEDTQEQMQKLYLQPYAGGSVGGMYYMKIGNGFDFSIGLGYSCAGYKNERQNLPLKFEDVGKYHNISFPVLFGYEFFLKEKHGISVMAGMQLDLLCRTALLYKEQLYAGVINEEKRVLLSSKSGHSFSQRLTPIILIGVLYHYSPAKRIVFDLGPQISYSFGARGDVSLKDAYQAHQQHNLSLGLRLGIGYMFN
ncbi:MAG: outer membrane beta-barrel protein [Bacteroidales bacterium]|nr:outer membrane beta-barrel protein [Bacteroidales bacterium]